MTVCKYCLIAPCQKAGKPSGSRYRFQCFLAQECDLLHKLFSLDLDSALAVHQPSIYKPFNSFNGFWN